MRSKEVRVVVKGFDMLGGMVTVEKEYPKTKASHTSRNFYDYPMEENKQ